MENGTRHVRRGVLKTGMGLRIKVPLIAALLFVLAGGCLSLAQWRLAELHQAQLFFAFTFVSLVLLGLALVLVIRRFYLSPLQLDITGRKAAEAEMRRRYAEASSFNTELEKKIAGRTAELKLALQTADAASRAKSDFLSSMSHELRTPLTAVIGFSQVLQEQYFGELNEKQQEYVRNILDSGQHLLTIINDVLDLAKVEAGKMELEPEEVDIPALIENSLTLIREKCLHHNISLETRLGGAGVITADRLRLKQVLYNLLSNAARFTLDGGKITVTARTEGEEAVVSVRDTGVGIAPENQKHIFESFYQVQTDLTHKTPGSGLGLALCKRFVELHGGRIWFTSEGEGKGCEFSFAVPVRPRSSLTAASGRTDKSDSGKREQK